LLLDETKKQFNPSNGWEIRCKLKIVRSGGVSPNPDDRLARGEVRGGDPTNSFQHGEGVLGYGQTRLHFPSINDTGKHGGRGAHEALPFEIFF
jgi:hypothetical protein